MDLKEFLEHLLPFPPGELSAQDVERPRDLHDPMLAEVIFYAFLDGALLQGAEAEAAAAFATLATEVITGWAVAALVPEAVQQAFYRSLDPAGTTAACCWLMDDWEAILTNLDIPNALENAWQAAKRMCQRP
jgi:hypothetical protein